MYDRADLFQLTSVQDLKRHQYILIKNTLHFRVLYLWNIPHKFQGGKITMKKDTQNYQQMKKWLL